MPWYNIHILLNVGENMCLYKIMVVDDEEEIRKGIIKKIDWEAHGFEVVGEGENGQEALEKAEKLHPDIVMTDIKMPYMDGLQLGERLIHLIPTIKLIIFSGSDDFEYAQRAIKLNAVEYVLKPINSMELSEILKKLKKKLDSEYDERRNYEKLYKHYLESIPILREQFLVGAIEGRISAQQWEKEGKRLELNLFNFDLSVAVIHIDGTSKKAVRESVSFGDEEVLLSLSVKKLIEDNLDNYCAFTSFPYLDEVVVIGCLSKERNILSFIQGINAICKLYENLMGITISAGIGNVYSKPQDLNYSFKAAKTALEYRKLLGIGKTIYIEDVEPDNNMTLNLEEKEEVKLRQAVKMGSLKELKDVVNGLFNKVENNILPINKYKIYLMEVLTVLLRLAQSFNLEVEKIFGFDFDCFKYINSFSTLEEIKENFISLSYKINEEIKKERIHTTKLLVNDAKDYVKKHYMDFDMSVDSICSYLHVSPTYFSTIFKRETDMNFVNYLTNVRLEEALRLLNTTDEKSYIIATKVGYQEPNYFSYVFKRKFGVSPKKYRKN